MNEEKEDKLQKIRDCSKIYAAAKGERVKLEHFRKSKLAILMKKYEPEHKTTTAQEREARADPEYVEVIEGLAEATEIEAREYWNLKITELQFSAWQTKQANKRAEMNRYNVKHE